MPATRATCASSASSVKTRKGPRLFQIGSPTHPGRTYTAPNEHNQYPSLSLFATPLNTKRPHRCISTTNKSQTRRCPAARPRSSQTTRCRRTHPGIRCPEELGRRVRCTRRSRQSPRLTRSLPMVWLHLRIHQLIWLGLERRNLGLRTACTLRT